MKVRLTDTAGIREGAGKIEAIGIERAKRRAESADLVLVLGDASAGKAVFPIVDNPEVIHIGTKVDLLAAGPAKAAESVAPTGPYLARSAQLIPAVAADHPPLMVSSVSGQGIDELLGLLGDRAKQAAGETGDVLPSRLRHIDLLRETAAHLESSLAAEGRGLELRADDLRLAADRLGRISGAVDVEDLLDVIFSQFCIGK